MPFNPSRTASRPVFWEPVGSPWLLTLFERLEYSESSALDDSGVGLSSFSAGSLLTEGCCFGAGFFLALLPNMLVQLRMSWPLASQISHHKALPSSDWVSVSDSCMVSKWRRELSEA